MADTTNSRYCANWALSLLQPTEAPKTRTDHVEELLRQNHPLLDVELPAFREIVETTPATLQDLDSKIVQARALLDNLLLARQQVQSHFEDAKSLLHPMRSMPNELLAEIFGHCILKEYDDETPDSLDPRAAPWLLTRVSRRWRELAVNLPQLWTFLLLDFDKHRGHISNYQCAYKVGVFTERSRGLPMTVYLGSEHSIMSHSVLPILEVSIPRWRYLRVDLPRSSLQRLSGNNFSMLQAIFLQYNKEDEWHLQLDVFKLVSAPVLHCMQVSFMKSWRALENVTLPWSHLTSIVSFPAFDSDGLTRLRTLTNLEDLDVDVNIVDIHTPIRDVVPLPNLRHLTINEGDGAPGCSKEFFSALEIPALSELTLTYGDQSVLHFPTSPLPLGNLTKLDITCEMNSHSRNTQHLLDFLTLAPHVECLRLHDINMTVEFCDGLNLFKCADSTTFRLPYLRFLDISNCRYSPTLAKSLTPLVDMLYSRLLNETAERTAGGKETDTDGNSPPVVGGGSDSKANSNSKGHDIFLKTIRLPRSLYIRMREVWQGVFPDLALQAEY